MDAINLLEGSRLPYSLNLKTKGEMMKMKVNLQKKKAIVAAMLLTTCVCGQAWAVSQPEQSIITISADGKQLKIVEKDTKTYDPNVAANANHLKQHDGVYYFENNDGKSFESIEWNGEESMQNTRRPVKEFLAGDRDYTILTKQLTVIKSYDAEDIFSHEEHIIKVGENKTINLGEKDKRIEKLNMAGNILGNGTVNIFAKDVEWSCNAIGRYAQAVDKNLNLNLNADRIKLVGTNYDNGQCDIEGTVNINQDSNYKQGIVQIEGFLATNDDASKVNINFYGTESKLTGAIWEGDEFGDLKGRMHFTFDQGATWNMTNAISVLSSLELLNSSVLNISPIDNPYTDGFGYLEVNKLNGSDGIIKMSFDGSKKIEASNPTESPFNIANHGDFVTVTGTHTGDTSLILKNTSDDTSKVAGRVLVMVKDEQGSFKVEKTEGALSWENYKLEQKQVNPDDYLFRYNDSVNTAALNAANETWTGWTIAEVIKEVVPEIPTTSVNTLLSTITAGYDTWRNDTDKFNERMGELRLNGAGSEGVWVRTKGSEFGRHSSNGSYTNKQQTYQLGYDAVTSKNEKQTTYTGMAAEYGKGSLSFDNGTGTMKSMGLGVYQSQLRESGHYLDLTYRFDKYKNDFHVADSMGNPISGKYGNKAMSLSAEYGRKNALKHGWYVEPQSEVTLGYMFGNDFTTSNNIRVEQKNMPALIGRLGLNIGREVSDKVNFYVKASVNHDFLGNYDMHMTDMRTGERLNMSDKFSSSWFDYGAGMSVKTGKDSYAYFDIERAVGGEYKKNWDWNAGVRWSF